MASSPPQEHSDDDMIDQEADAAPPSTQARRATDIAAADRIVLVSAARDEPYPPSSQPQHSDDLSTERSLIATSSVRDEPLPTTSQPPPHGRPRDLAIEIAYGPPPYPAATATQKTKKNVIPGGLSFEQLHLPPGERRPLLHAEQTSKNLVEYGSLNGPEDAVTNDPVNIPSHRERLARAKEERLRREAERDREKEREEKVKKQGGKRGG